MSNPVIYNGVCNALRTGKIIALGLESEIVSILNASVIFDIHEVVDMIKINTADKQPTPKNLLPPFRIMWFELTTMHAASAIYVSRQEMAVAATQHKNLSPLIGGTEYMVGIRLFSTSDEDNLYRLLPITFYTEIDRYGAIIEDRVEWTNDYAEKLIGTLDPTIQDRLNEAVQAGAFACKLAISLLNCKNIDRMEHTNTAVLRRDKRNPAASCKPPVTKYYTLDIDLDKTPGVRKVNDEATPTGHFMPLHIRRGHMVHYTPERPPFGRPISEPVSWWVPDMKVGTADAGIIVKDYQLDKH